MYEIESNMVQHGMTMYTVDGFVAKLKTVDASSVTDWSATLEYIKMTGSVDLLQKRLTESAVKARWDSGVDIPGVDKIVKHTVTIKKE